jgi:hypothetical protein
MSSRRSPARASRCSERRHGPPGWCCGSSWSSRRGTCSSEARDASWATDRTRTTGREGSRCASRGSTRVRRLSSTGRQRSGIDVAHPPSPPYRSCHRCPPRLSPSRKKDPMAGRARRWSPKRASRPSRRRRRSTMGRRACRAIGTRCSNGCARAPKNWTAGGDRGRGPRLPRRPLVGASHLRLDGGFRRKGLTPTSTYGLPNCVAPFPAPPAGAKSGRARGPRMVHA